MVPNTSELLPEPDTPVKTVSRRFGSSTLTSFRLLTRAPCTRIRSWLSEACTSGACFLVFGGIGVSVLRERGELPLGVLVPAHSLDGVLPPTLHVLQGVFVRGVTRCDRIPEVLVLRLDHLVG